MKLEKWGFDKFYKTIKAQVGDIGIGLAKQIYNDNLDRNANFVIKEVIDDISGSLNNLQIYITGGYQLRNGGYQFLAITEDRDIIFFQNEYQFFPAKATIKQGKRRKNKNIITVLKKDIKIDSTDEDIVSNFILENKIYCDPNKIIRPELNKIYFAVINIENVKFNVDWNKFKIKSAKKIKQQGVKELTKQEKAIIIEESPRYEIMDKYDNIWLKIEGTTLNNAVNVYVNFNGVPLSFFWTMILKRDIETYQQILMKKIADGGKGIQIEVSNLLDTIKQRLQDKNVIIPLQLRKIPDVSTIGNGVAKLLWDTNGYAMIPYLGSITEFLQDVKVGVSGKSEESNEDEDIDIVKSDEIEINTEEIIAKLKKMLQEPKTLEEVLNLIEIDEDILGNIITEMHNQKMIVVEEGEDGELRMVIKKDKKEEPKKKERRKKKEKPKEKIKEESKEESKKESKEEPKEESKEEDYTEYKQKVIKYLKSKKEPQTMEEIINGTGIDDSLIPNILWYLLDEEEIQQIDKGNKFQIKVKK